ncbi:MAG: acyl carrier protein [Methyloversatilis sp.]|nr:acyl carrier protein [Methyloversatilis sp.]
MNIDQVRSTIIDLVGNILLERGEALPEIAGDTRLLGGPISIDSLDLATLVVQLEATFGKDPFQSGFIEFRTVDELAALYID